VDLIVYVADARRFIGDVLGKAFHPAISDRAGQDSFALHHFDFDVRGIDIRIRRDAFAYIFFHSRVGPLIIFGCNAGIVHRVRRSALKAVISPSGISSIECTIVIGYVLLGGTSSVIGIFAAFRIPGRVGGSMPILAETRATTPGIIFVAAIAIMVATITIVISVCFTVPTATAIVLLSVGKPRAFAPAFDLRTFHKIAIDIGVIMRPAISGKAKSLAIARVSKIFAILLGSAVRLHTIRSMLKMGLMPAAISLEPVGSGGATALSIWRVLAVKGIPLGTFAPHSV